MGPVLDIRGLGDTEARELLGEQLAAGERCDEVLCLVQADDLIRPWQGLSVSGQGVISRPLLADTDRVLFTLRKDSCPGPLNPSVVSFMKSEHERVYSLMEALDDAARDGHSQRAETFLELLVALLRRHIEVEESLLMPILSSRHGQQRGPAAVLRDDHIKVVELLENLSALVATQGGLVQVSRRVEDLVELLDGHVVLEEKLVYELADEHLDDEERSSLLDFCYSMA